MPPSSIDISLEVSGPRGIRGEPGTGPVRHTEENKDSVIEAEVREQFTGVVGNAAKTTSDIHTDFGWRPR